MLTYAGAYAGAYVDVEGLSPVEVELALNPTAQVYIHTPMFNHTGIHTYTYVCMYVFCPNLIYVCVYVCMYIHV
jgi:hypothetical protein